jgi:hypothetical protein
MVGETESLAHCVSETILFLQKNNHVAIFAKFRFEGVI